MTKIFYGDEEERDFSHPDKYAFLNWCMDDGMGTQQRPAKVQKVFDNYYMGRAYLGNALLSLYTLISKNHYGTADVLVFPIMFDIWHLIDTIEYDYPTFHLSMDCFWCEVESGELKLLEAEAAMWLTKDRLDSVEWLPADITLIDKIRREML